MPEHTVAAADKNDDIGCCGYTEHQRRIGQLGDPAAPPNSQGHAELEQRSGNPTDPANHVMWCGLLAECPDTDRADGQEMIEVTMDQVTELLDFLYHSLQRAQHHPMLEGIALNAWGKIDYKYIWVKL
ncbi:hypothetical protein ACFVQB_20665 [Paenibacillus sp. NPDC057886]|uniref:hypothetical protein n=1 Tax=Paenibacillus sp. NPDC057886 TaxID=3346270 RepID=UPI003693AB72